MSKLKRLLRAVHAELGDRSLCIDEAFAASLMFGVERDFDEVEANLNVLGLDGSIVRLQGLEAAYSGVAARLELTLLKVGARPHHDAREDGGRLLPVPSSRRARRGHCGAARLPFATQGALTSSSRLLLGRCPRRGGERGPRVLRSPPLSGGFGLKLSARGFGPNCSAKTADLCKSTRRRSP